MVGQRLKRVDSPELNARRLPRQHPLSKFLATDAMHEEVSHTTLWAGSRVIKLLKLHTVENLLPYEPWLHGKAQQILGGSGQPFVVSQRTLVF